MFLTCQTSKTPTLRDQLKALDYDYHRSDIPYLAHESEASLIDSLHKFYSSAIHYFENQFSIQIPLKIAFVRQQDYNQLNLHYHPYYGIPHVEDNYLIIPVEPKGLVFKYLEIQLRDGPEKHLEKFQQTKRFDVKGVSSVMHITAVHEIGRHFQHLSSLPTEPKWLNDFISSYLMIDFLHNNYPSYNSFVNAFCNLVTHQITPSYKNLDVFEEKYMHDEHSYSWYQSKIHLAAYTVYQQEGIDFFHNYREHVTREQPGLMFPLDTLMQYFNP